MLRQEEKATPLARENPGVQIKGQQNKQPHRLFRVRIMDNDYNTYEQVIRICMKALSIGFEEALQIALAVDHNGHADVFHGDETSARQVAAVISSIGIEVRVEPLTAS
ncbi:MAG: ATP-dependent Clp protease adaptor ClpS [Leptospiraceae bacterium]|nr:ATP-dependent Clp protease adaptor ClpS [Leptospiraceae bacterium]